MKQNLQASAPLLFRPRVTPEPAAMESLQKRMAAFCYTPEGGLHRDKIQMRLQPVAARRAPSRLSRTAGSLAR